MLERYLLIWLVGSSFAAYSWPEIVSVLPESQQFDPFVASNEIGLLPWLIALTMFSIGLMLPRDEVNQVFRRWPTVFGGTTIQYLAMPALAWLMGTLFQLEGDYFVGIVMVGCVPGAMASNVLTLNARGNTSYSVSLTTAATLLSPLAVPLVLSVALATEKSVTVPFVKTSVSLLLTVVGPVVTGHCLSRVLRLPEELTRRLTSIIANLAILWIIAVVVGITRDRLSQFNWLVLCALLAVNLLGYTAGLLGGFALRLPDSMRRALTLEVGMQNAGLGAALAGQLFDDRPLIAIAPAMYTFGCMLTGTVLARIWASRGSGDDESPSPDEATS